MRNNVIDYEVIPASQDVGNRFDANNFYPFDGDIFSQEIDEDEEHSELFGIKSKKDGGRGLFGTIGDAFRGGLSKEEAQDNRMDKKAERSRLKNRRRNERQKRKMATLPGPIKLMFKKLSKKNPEVNASASKVQQGVGNPKDEKVVDNVIKLAKEVVDGNISEENALGLDMNEGGGYNADEIIKKAKEDEKTKEDESKGWKALSTGAKVGIIGGGVLVLGLVTFLIIRAKKK